MPRTSPCNVIYWFHDTGVAAAVAGGWPFLFKISMTLLPVLALGAKITYCQFTSTFEWLNKVILSSNLSCDKSIMTLLFNTKLSITITSIAKNWVEEVCFHFQYFIKKWCKKIMKVKSLLIQRSLPKVKVCRLNLKICFLSVWWNRVSIKYLNTILTQTLVGVIQAAIMRTVAFVEYRNCPKEDKICKICGTKSLNGNFEF